MTTRNRIRDTFRDLALALPEDERKALHSRIVSSLSLRSSGSPGSLTSGTSAENKEELIHAEMVRLSFWQRIRYFLRKLLSSHSDEQAYLEFRLAEVRRRAIRALPGLRPMEPHSVSSEVAVQTWDLYRAAYPVIPLFLDFWREEHYLQRAIEHLLREHIPDAKDDLYSFASLRELQETFYKNERKGEVRSLVLDRLEHYLAEIPKDILEDLANGLEPFYFLKQVAIYDYNTLFKIFGFDPGISPPEDVPPFSDAPTSAALPPIELLYLALYTTAKLSEDFHMHSEVLDRYLAMKHAERRPGVGQEDDDTSQESAEAEQRRKRVSELELALRKLLRASRSVAGEVPLADIIRFYARDPWIRSRPYVPRIQLEVFYRSELTMKLLAQLDERFPEVRKGVIERMVRRLFGGEPNPLNHFKNGPHLLAERYESDRYTHIYSLTVTFDFLRKIFHGRMHEMFRILARILPVRQRDSSSDLARHLAGVDEIYADIEDFDASFSPESEDGKAYFRIRYGVEKDVSLQRSYHNQLLQRDRESGVLVERAVEHLRGLHRVVKSLQSTLTDQIRERYASNDPRVNELDGLDQLLAREAQKLEQFERVISHIRAMEQGH
ncbi:MAG: DUF5312 family protein [Spirochaetales bacterium]